MTIFLTGFMGAGKTTVGKKLAALMHFDFLDLDQHIEKETGKTIQQLFEAGEHRFREIETHILKKKSSKKNLIIATGGGTACFNDNMEWMNENGFTVYLKLSVGSLFHRLAESKQVRPLLSGKSDVSLMEYIMNTLASREHYYNKAKLIFKGEDAEIKDLVEKLKKEIS